MSNNKKFLAVSALTILLPLFLLFYVPFFRDQNGVISYSDNRVLFFFLIWIPIISCVYIIFKNYLTKTHNIIWYIVASLLGVMLFLFWYSIYSLSNFGF